MRLKSACAYTLTPMREKVLQTLIVGINWVATTIQASLSL